MGSPCKPEKPACRTAQAGSLTGSGSGAMPIRPLRSRARDPDGLRPSCCCCCRWSAACTTMWDIFLSGYKPGKVRCSHNASRMHRISSKLVGLQHRCMPCCNRQVEHRTQQEFEWNIFKIYCLLKSMHMASLSCRNHQHFMATCDSCVTHRAFEHQ